MMFYEEYDLIDDDDYHHHGDYGMFFTKEGLNKNNNSHDSSKMDSGWKTNRNWRAGLKRNSGDREQRNPLPSQRSGRGRRGSWSSERVPGAEENCHSDVCRSCDMPIRPEYFCKGESRCEHVYVCKSCGNYQKPRCGHAIKQRTEEVAWRKSPSMYEHSYRNGDDGDMSRRRRRSLSPRRDSDMFCKQESRCSHTYVCKLCGNYEAPAKPKCGHAVRQRTEEVAWQRSPSTYEHSYEGRRRSWRRLDEDRSPSYYEQGHRRSMSPSRRNNYEEGTMRNEDRSPSYYEQGHRRSMSPSRRNNYEEEVMKRHRSMWSSK
jgi:hypothetical protein